MTDNAYIRAMEHVKFDERFEDRMVAFLERESIKYRRNRRTAVYTCCASAVAACAVLAVLLVGTPGGDLTAQYAVQATAAATADASFLSAAPTVDSRSVAVSSEYGGGEADSYIAPGPGDVLITEEVRRALEDEVNEGKYFFVHIYVLMPELYANSFSSYVYNGRTVKEWRELVDLSNGEYPYSEYNMDHGGSITEEQFKELKKQAKTLDAGKNYEAAEAEYEADITPMLEGARSARERTEMERLKSLGYDVFLADTWTYKGEGEKERYQILAGVLSKDQISGFASDEKCGYSIEWVHNGDGVVDWTEYQTEFRK